MPDPKFTKPGDVFKLKLEEIDKLNSNVLKDALKSVLRDPGQVAYHKDHRSHSNLPDKVANIKGKVTNPGG